METKFKRKFVGKVVKLSGTNTVKVKVETKYAHPKYGRIIKKHKNFLVHSTDTNIGVDDLVEIQESRPISKMKRWILLRKIESK